MVFVCVYIYIYIYIYNMCIYTHMNSCVGECIVCVNSSQRRCPYTRNSIGGGGGGGGGEVS